MDIAEPVSPFLRLLRNRIDLVHIPFTERSARMLFFRERRTCDDGVGPETCFYIRLAERWVKQEPQQGNYRQRRPIVYALCFTSPGGEPLPIEQTTYPHEVIFSTPLGIVEMAFLDAETLYFRLPEQPIGVRFQIQADHGAADRRGGTFHGTRNTAYTFNGPLQQNHVRELDDGHFEARATTSGGAGGAMLLNISPRLGYNRSIPPAEAVFQDAEQRWHNWFAAAPPVAERFQVQYYYAWSVMRAGLISPRYYMTREGMTPSKIHYVGVWQWDAFFHALAYRHVDTRLAEDQVRLVLDHQREDGMIPDAIHDEGIITHLSQPVEADVTKPPLAAWTALKLFATSGHRDFLDEIYEPLVRWNRWWYERNDDDRDGLCQYNHPFSSGLDDSPLWDEGMPVTSPDLNTYLCIQQQALAEIADLIGERDDATLWRQQAHETARRMIERMWDAEAGLFWALRRTPDGQEHPVRVMTPFSLYPLWTGELSSEMAARVLTHLTDPGTFWTRYPLPTVARCDPHYDPNQMWRGPTWVNINYLFCEGLERTGHVELARELRQRTLDLIMGHDDIYEYYHPETGMRPPKAAPLFGWTAAVFIDMAIQASRPASE
jgi:hypothetical protein